MERLFAGIVEASVVVAGAAAGDGAVVLVAG